MKKITTGIILLLFSSISFADVIHLKVDEVTEVYENVSTGVSYACKHDYDDNSIGLDTIVGIVLGVGIGNQIGAGTGREVARVVGGLTGGSVANSMRDEHCHSTDIKKILVGYKNCVFVNNRKLCKITDSPKEYLQIR